MMMFPFDATAVQSQCIQLDNWREQLDRKGPLSRRWNGRLRRDLEAEAVAGSLRIEQIPITVDEVRRILAGTPSGTTSDRDRQLVEGYLDAMGFVLRRADDPIFSWNEELIRSLHDRILAGDWSTGAGRFATSPRWLADRETGEETFVPAEYNRIQEYVEQACSHAQTMVEHPAIIAAWIHIAIAAIHPFRDGNGRTARVLSSLAMYRGNFQRREFTSLEEWWGRHVREYYQAFSCLGATFDPKKDVTPFMIAHVDAQLSQVRALDLRERVERKIWTAIENIAIDRTLHPRLAHAIWEAFWERDVTSGYYVGMTDVSTATATKDLAAATAAQLLSAQGERRARRYRAGSELLSLVSNELQIKNLPLDLAAARGKIGQILAMAAAPGSNSRTEGDEENLHYRYQHQ